MILAGSPDKLPNTNAELSPEVEEGFRREFGRKGLSAVAVETSAVGYPADVDEQGDYIVTVEPSDGQAKVLQPGDIGYSAKNISETGPQVLDRN